MSTAIRVMVVEDDFMVADINRQVTEGVEGYTVVKVALSGAAALAELALGNIDLVVLDVYLPDIQGLELLKEARRLDYPVDFILITAAQDTRTVEQSMRYGIVDYIIKPFDLERYRSALLAYRDRRLAIVSGRPMDQGSLDKMLVREAAEGTGRPLPKGISPMTLDKTRAFLVERPGDIVAADMAKVLSISRVTARRYLEFLAESGELRKEIRYQKVGRPLVYYSRLA